MQLELTVFPVKIKNFIWHNIFLSNVWPIMHL